MCRVLDDGDNAFEFFASKLTGAVFRCQLFRLFAFDLMVLCIPLVEVDVGLLAHQVGVALAHTLDLGQGEHDFLPAYLDCKPFVHHLHSQNAALAGPTNHRRSCSIDGAVAVVSKILPLYFIHAA